MTTIRQHVGEQDRHRFVARTDELAVFDDLLTGRSSHRVIHLVGPGGIGKSTLLREVARRAAERSMRTLWIDGRDVAPFPVAVGRALDTVAEADAALVVIDSYELIVSLDSHLRDVIVAALPDSTTVVFASRQPPPGGWFDHGWDAVTRVVTLEGLDRRAATQLALAHGAPEYEVGELVRRARGNPLVLTIGDQGGRHDSASELARRLLGNEVDPSRMRILGVAAIARVTTPELLASVLDDDDPHASFAWLADRSFSEALTDGLALHALVAESIRESMRRSDPVGEGRLRRRIADFLHRRAVGGRDGLSIDLQHLVVDPAVKWGFAADVASRYRIDTIRPGDVDHIEQILVSVGAMEWWSTTRPFLELHPECCGVARDLTGAIGGYFVAVSPADAPALAEADPFLGPWLRYAREVLRTESAVLWREAVDLTGELGEITSFLGAGGLMSTGVANPRYGFLPISPVLPAAGEFSRALGAQHVSHLDMSAHGMTLECHVVDFGPQGLLGFQRDWVYRESGASPPIDAGNIEPADLLALLRDRNGFANGPHWLGPSPSARRERLSRLVRDSLSAFGDTDDDRLGRSIIELAFLGDNDGHESIARRLHLSRSAYFRRLQRASSRVADELGSRILRDR